MAKSKTVFKSKCSQCGYQTRRNSRAESLASMRRHQWSKHPSWLRSRIKLGQARAEHDNPSIQDLIQAINKGSSRAAQSVAKLMTETRYSQVKKVMDSVQPILPLKAQLAWEGVEAAHDIYRKIKSRR